MKGKTIGKASRKGVSAAAIVAALLLATPMLLLIAPVHATSITSISPASGSVGTTVTLIGTIDTFNGPFRVYFDANGDDVFADGEVVASGTAVGTSVSVSFTVPAAAKGVHAIRLTDVIANTHGFAAFTVTTAVAIALSPTSGRIQERDDITITVSISGGLASETYTIEVHVTDPTSTTRSATLSIATNSLGSGSGSVTYPVGFTGADTNLVGTYSISVDITAPSSEAATGVASSSFTVRLTDKDSYERTETVNIKGAGYGATESVTIDIKDPSGASVSGFPRTVTASAGVVTDTFTIPKDAPTGTYTVILTGATTSKTPPDTQTFAVTAATLSVTITDQPASSYQRTQIATMKFRVTYPDGSLFTPSDLGSVTVKVYRGATPVATLTLTASDFESATNKWVARWTIPKDATVATNYRFQIDDNAITDTFGNTGPASAEPSNTFAVTTTTLAVPAISTDKPTYVGGSWMIIFFTASYPDGSPVTTGTVTITIKRPDGSTAGTSTASFSAANARFEASFFLPTDAPLGTWTAELAATSLNDGFGNTGPTTLKTTTFQVVAPTITLETIYDVLTTQVVGKLGMFSGSDTVASLLYDIKTAVDGVSDKLGTFGPGETVKGLLDDIKSAVDKLGTFTGTDTVASLLYAIEAKLDDASRWVSDADLSTAVSTITSAISEVSDKLGTFGPGDTVASLLYQIRAAVTALDLAPVRAGDVVSSKAETDKTVTSATPYVIGGFPANKAFRGTLTVQIDTTLGSGVFLAVEVWDGDSWARV
jgi:hypothetical protein